MKLIAFFIMIFTMQLSANVFSQEIRFDITKQEVKVSEIIDILKSKTDFIFFYNQEINEDQRVSVNVDNSTIQDVLDEITSQMNCSYKIMENYVIIRKENGSEEIIFEKHKIKGKVTDENGLPLVGVTVIIKGTTTGAATDIDGIYELSLPSVDDITLVFSFMGMETQEIIITDQDEINIILKESTSNVDEVIITGYFNVGKQGYTGTATTFSQKEIKKVSTGNLLTTLAILDAGFRIHEDNKQGSNPNKVPDFTIRGRGSFQNGSTQPVFMVDGFQMSAQFVMDMDPNRIKSMTILKDASATIFYGSRAANGVIVIETIAPKAGNIRVTYDFRPHISFPDLTDYNLMNAAQKLEYEQRAGLFIDKDPREQARLEQKYYQKYKAIQEGVDTYWLSQPVRTTLSQAHSIYVEGGVEQVRYGIDVGYNNTQGIMKGSGNDRYDLGFKLIYRIAEKITIQNYASYSYKDRFNSPYGNFSTYTKLNPYERYKDEKGKLIPTLSDWNTNPLYDAELPNKNNSVTQSFTEQLSLDWTINNAFRFKGKFNLTKSDIASEMYRSPFSSIYTINRIESKKRGYMTITDGKSLFISSNITLQYNKKINKHTLFFGAGGEITYNSDEMHGFSVQGFPDDKYQDVSFAIQYVENSKPFSSSSISKSVGAFFNGNYIYDDKYFIDASVRYDGSSKFGSDNKFAPFWSVGAGWNIHKENFWNSNIFNEFKLRYNYGVTGNQEFSAYQAITMYTYNTDLSYNNTIPASLRGFGNSALKWQEQYSHNLGLDIVLWDNRIVAKFNYYTKRTIGMLAEITVAPSVGFPNGTYTANLGEIENKGVEFNMNAVLIRDRTNDLEWAIGIQVSHNKSKILKISEELKTVNDQNNKNKKVPGNVYEEGESMTALKVVHSLGIDPATGEELFLKKDGTTVTSIWDANDKVVFGDTEPDFFGNVNNNLFWKGWNLNMVFRFAYGADIYNQTLVDKIENINPHNNADVRALNNRWHETGDIAKYKNISNNNRTYISSRFVQKENLLQLKTLSLSYQFKSEQLKKYKIKTLRLSFYANDLFRISTIKHERGTTYPFARSYVFGLNIGF